MEKDIKKYNDSLEADKKEICNQLAMLINKELTDAESKIWHAHPVWFLDGNPIVGYSNLKSGIKLMFWSGAGFDEAELDIRGEKFKDASTIFTHISDIKVKDLKRWLSKSRVIQWDYKNIVKRKGKLLKLKTNIETASD